MLREVTQDDLPIFFEHQRDPEALRMAAFPPRDWAAFLHHWQTNVLPNRAGVKRTIVEDGQVAGFVTSWEMKGDRFVAYWLGREHWGRGVATRALGAFLAVEPTRPLLAWVATENRGSIRVLEKCGFARVAGSDRGGDDGVAEVLMRLEASG